MKLIVIGDSNTVMGFHLAGVECIVAAGKVEALAAIQQAFATPDVGVILMTESLACEIRDEFDAYLYGRGFPLLLEVPGADGPCPGRLSVEDMVRKAIGMSL